MVAVEDGCVDPEERHYESLQEVMVHVTEAKVRERVDDQQLKHAIRAMDDRARILK
ncbi:hypothetical protein [Salinigranum marinum]|uniref:hypothetical protein n=1 Tax=Salinigranum marinum TaxID=1515595 RepID=UPI002989CB61|nr:hypothetical protein [Salinigranum marinum]